MLFGSGLIPGILWLITYLTASKDNTNPNNQGGSYGGGYDGGHNNSGSTNKSDEYNNGDLYN
jgi:hypothetical protein